MLEDNLGESVPRALDRIYAGGKRLIASFAPLVFEAYEMSDSIAKYIIENTAGHVAKMISTARRRLDASENDVVMTGGLFKRADILLPLIRKNLKGHHNFIFPVLPPIYGSVIQASALAGIEADGEFENNFMETFEEAAYELHDTDQGKL